MGTASPLTLALETRIREHARKSRVHFDSALLLGQALKARIRVYMSEARV